MLLILISCVLECVWFQIAFTGVVYPCLVIAYMGEAAYLSKHREDLHISFYKAIPGEFFCSFILGWVKRTLWVPWAWKGIISTSYIFVSLKLVVAISAFDPMDMLKCPFFICRNSSGIICLTLQIFHGPSFRESNVHLCLVMIQKQKKKMSAFIWDRRFPKMSHMIWSEPTNYILTKCELSFIFFSFLDLVGGI